CTGSSRWTPDVLRRPPARLFPGVGPAGGGITSAQARSLAPRGQEEEEGVAGDPTPPGVGIARTGRGYGRVARVCGRLPIAPPPSRPRPAREAPPGGLWALSWRTSGTYRTSRGVAP